METNVWQEGKKKKIIQNTWLMSYKSTVIYWGEIHKLPGAEQMSFQTCVVEISGEV